MEGAYRSESVPGGASGPLRETARGQACMRNPLFYAVVSAATFAAYGVTVSAAGAPPSVHAAGLLLWVAHVILLFGRTPGQKSSSCPRRLGELGRAEALDRAADAAAGLSSGAADRGPGRR
jgi:hypothetical protein